MKNKVYPDLPINYNNKEWLAERSILAPTNDTVDSINNDILKKIPELLNESISIDTLVNIEDYTHYPLENLHALQPPGFDNGNVIMVLQL